MHLRYEAGVFVVTAEEAERSGSPRSVLVPAVDTDDIFGRTLGTPSRCAILPPQVATDLPLVGVSEI